MKVRIQVVIEAENGAPEKVEEIAQLQRGALRAEELGLTLAEAKALLHGMQQAVVIGQIEEYLEKFKTCPDCGAHRTRKGKHPLAYRTLFGKVNLVSPRLYDCACQNHGNHSSSPLAKLLSTHCAPELLYLEIKFASLMSYGLSVELLTEILPIAEEISPTSMRRHQQRVAERMEGELGEEQCQFIEGCPLEWAKQPPPGPPLTVGLDGGYVHASDQKSKTEGWFEVITGKSVQTEGDAKVFAFVNKYDTKPKRRLYEVLKSQGLQMNQQVVFLSDGGDTVRDLQHYLSPESEHLLDWFHITMRLTVMRQMIKGMTAELKPDDKHPETAAVVADLERHLDSLKWNLWHGNVLHALHRTGDLDDDLDMLEENMANKKKLEKAVREFHSYIEANQAFIPNYGDRYRHDETISTAFVESTVNYVVSKRFVKKQQMRWSQRGAHLLLQTRVQVLNDDLRKTFGRWFAGMRDEEAATLQEAA
ncbi:ISKra4 family transposase ISAfe13 [Paraburkholderia nemoris]|uniref:ISKra4 family transposase n=1 Tax=Paraburkholderia nemoris TaxID=2793076 RepID=UPI00190BBAB3|nr:MULTISPECIES: ISKra4 family transposase [Paraburkholderia]MBK3787219.1 ISKra4 family transposase [Paraburkholderia aspalathi]CAE6869026.1 ISKra4 family transposase ISAfe13 [Paraburkholderia nemoris]